MNRNKQIGVKFRVKLETTVDFQKRAIPAPSCMTCVADSPFQKHTTVEKMMHRKSVVMNLHESIYKHSWDDGAVPGVQPRTRKVVRSSASFMPLPPPPLTAFTNRGNPMPAACCSNLQHLIHVQHDLVFFFFFSLGSFDTGMVVMSLETHSDVTRAEMLSYTWGCLIFPHIFCVQSSHSSSDAFVDVLYCTPFDRSLGFVSGLESAYHVAAVHCVMVEEGGS